MKPNIRRLLIIRLGAMGDLLHASPSARLLKACRPDVEIHWLTSPSYAALVSRFEGVDRVWPMPQRASDLARLAAELRACAIDGVVNLHPSLRTWALSVALLAPRGCDGRYARYRKERLRLSPCDERLSRRRRATEDFFATVSGLFSLEAEAPDDPQALAPRLSLEDATGEPPQRERRIALIPGVGAKRANRAWPLTHAATLLQRLLQSPEREAFQATLIGGPDDVAAAQTILRALPPSLRDRVENRCGRQDILQTAAILSRCRLVIGGDTGPTHLAAAVGAPLVALFGPTSARRTGPCGFGPLEIVTPPEALDCWPCERPICPQPSLIQADGSPGCMARLEVETVLAACERLLSTSQ